MPVRGDGTLPCCGGFGGEHFLDFCEVGAEIAELHRRLARRDVLRRRIDDDDSDRAWVAYSEACDEVDV